MIPFFYDLLYIVPVALTAIYYYCGLVGVQGNRGLYLFTLAVLTILTLVPHLRARGRLLLLGITVIGFGGVFLVLNRTDSLTPEVAEALLPVLLIPILSFILGMLMARLRYFRLIMVLIMAVAVGLSMEYYPLPQTAGKGIFGAFFLVIYTVANEIHLRWVRSGDTDERKHMVFVAPFMLALVLLTALFKYPDHPYGWDGFINIWNRITTAFEQVKFNLEGSDDAVMGFSDDGEIFHSFGRGSEEVLLKLEAPVEYNAPIYLTGTYYDVFDGHRWSRSDEDFGSTRKYDVAESLAAAKAVAEDYMDVIRDANVYVEYAGAKSRYFFGPSKLLAVTTDVKNVTLRDNLGIITFGSHNPFRFRAGASFYRFNTDSSVFYDYMAVSHSLTEKEWTEGVANVTDAPSFEDYGKYREAMAGIYGGKVELSGGLREKLDLVYEGAASDYEKMKRLERSLNDMTYTEDTSPIPDSVEGPEDYLDFFLLDTGEGFCTHYATAFVLLARAEGLPARFCQGYRVECGPAGIYSVTDSAAHAWPEVYFEGKGWVAFEPTPGFNRSVAWMTVAAKREQLRDANNIPKVFDKTDENKTAERERVRINPLVLILPFTGVILFLVLFILVSRGVSGYRLGKMGPEEKLRWHLKEILSCLSILGYERGESETLSEFADRLSEDPGDMGTDWAGVCEKLLYSEYRGSREDEDIMTGCHKAVLSVLREENRFRYILKTLLYPV